jgi:hypothetical protein
MTPVAFGLALDHATPRRYLGTRATERPRRALSIRISLDKRSHAILRRCPWWTVRLHQHRASKPPTFPATPQEAA